MMWVNLLGLFVVTVIVWWFWLYREKPANVNSTASTIIVENGVYSPANIHLQAGEPATLNFLRKDPSPCAEILLIPALEISETLPLNVQKTIRLPGLKSGEYAFHCQMQMYRGQLTVEGGD